MNPASNIVHAPNHQPPTTPILQSAPGFHVDYSAIFDLDDRLKQSDDVAFHTQFEIIARAKADLKAAGQLQLPKPTGPRQERRSEHGSSDSHRTQHRRVTGSPGLFTTPVHPRGFRTRPSRLPAHRTRPGYRNKSEISLPLQLALSSQPQGSLKRPAYPVPGHGTASRDSGRLQRVSPLGSRVGIVHTTTGRRHLGMNPLYA